ncbi:uncharacterized protein LOC131620021 [Vicia villosa]|uniref:uncharacterized protein LOC131620021 n=1 Tax=Vicia villosa TaxID=3911 RepID=UPI00273CC3CB|nr:uncharacterized protein LOC131620021 [Vicia villosa]
MLFVLVIEYLHRCLHKLKYKPNFNYHPRCEKLRITNISFADDLVIFCRGDRESMKLLTKEFHEFSYATGLKAHHVQCKVIFGGVSYHERQHILADTGFAKSEMPFRYLGIPLSSRRLTIQQCRPLIMRIVTKIKLWAARLLSYVGRYQLIRSVLFTVTSYWMQIIHLQQKFIKDIEATCRSFLWSGKEIIRMKAPIAWEKMCGPKVEGGLNITSLKKWNMDTLGKLFWNIHKKEDKMWIQWLEIYISKVMMCYIGKFQHIALGF